MNKEFRLIFIVFLLLIGQQALAVTPLCSNPASTVPIADLSLAAAIKAKLKVPIITCQEILKLKDLTSQETHITSLEGLEHATNLAELDLSKNQISDLNALVDLSSLKVLNLSDNNIASITPIAFSTNLTILILNNNQIADIFLLTALSNLEELQIGGNPIPKEDLRQLQQLPNLTRLGLDRLDIGNANEVLNYIANPQQLTLLSLARTGITDLSFTSSLPNLERLIAWGNKIQSIQPLLGLQNLARLNISANELNDLSPLSNMQNLEFVQANSNQLMDLSALATLPNLKLVHLKNNNISDVSPLIANANFGLRERSVVFLEDNCLTQEDTVPLNELFNRGIRVTYEPQKQCQ